MTTENIEDAVRPENAYFVPSIPGFIPESWKKDGTYSDQSWPADAVILDQLITDRFWKKQAPEGKILGHIDGEPAWVDTVSIPSTYREIEDRRLKAYSDPLTGSDRLFSESTRMEIMGESGFEDVRARAISRFEEIQAQYPRPAE